MLHISHLHQLDPLADSGVVPEVDEHVGVEGEHETERDHKDCQEYHSEVGLLHCLGPTNKIADTFFPDQSLPQKALPNILD